MSTIKTLVISIWNRIHVVREMMLGSWRPNNWSAFNAMTSSDCACQHNNEFELVQPVDDRCGARQHACILLLV